MESINNVALSSPYVRDWLGRVSERGLLDLLVKSCKAAGVGETEEDILKFVDTLALGTLSSDLSLTVSDFQGRFDAKPWNRLLRASGIRAESKVSIEQFYLLCGTLTHEIVFRILSKSGELASLEDRFLYRIEECWRETIKALEDCEDTEISRYVVLAPFIDRLKEVLNPIGQSHIQKLLHKAPQGEFLADYFFGLTLLIWASVILWSSSKNESHILFREIRALPPDFGVGGGRLDALEVNFIDGRPLKRTEIAILKSMIAKRYRSVAHLLLELERVFSGRIIGASIVEWKSAVGDGLKKGVVLRPSDLGRIPLKHDAQIKRYLAFSNLGYAILTGRAEREFLWKDPGPIAGGSMVYLMPTLPITYEIKVTAQDQKNTFAKEVAARWFDAEWRARMRSLDQVVAGSISRVLEGKHREIKVPKAPHANQPPLFTEVAGTKDFFKGLIISSLAPVDTLGILFEIPGKRHRYLLHVAKLLEAIGSHSVATSGWSSSGGFISCPAPGHKDLGPSCRVYLDAGHFHCFGLGCNVHGQFMPGSVPEGMRMEGSSHIARTRVYTKKALGANETENILVPKDQAAIMSLAAELLQGCYKADPKPKEYLSKERGLDPDLAFELGAGYGTNQLVLDLLENGHTFEDLVRFGFVSFSSFVSCNDGLYPLLQRRGVRFSAKGLPYSVLNGYLTFPLAWGAQYSSFYGRAIWPNANKSQKHRKLKTGFPHGPFNARVLDLACPEVIICEGVMDALCLIEMGFKTTLALIGVNNERVAREVAKSGKNVVAAMDFDESGQAGTAQFFFNLVQAGFVGKFENLTLGFKEIRPDFEPFKDFNDWWVKIGQHSCKGTYKEVDLCSF